MDVEYLHIIHNDIYVDIHEILLELILLLLQYNDIYIIANDIDTKSAVELPVDVLHVNEVLV